MCYKAERQAAIADRMEEKLLVLPPFMRGYFSTLKSKVTRKNNYGHIVALFNYFISHGVIQKESIVDITTEDIQKIKYTDMIVYLDSLKGKNSEETIATKKKIYGGLWTYFVNSDYVLKNIVHKIEPGLFKPEKTNAEITVYVPTNMQLKEFQKNITKCGRSEFEVERNLAIVNLLLGSGIRSEELIGLDMGDLHLEDEPPHIFVLGKGKQTKQDKVEVSVKRLAIIQEYLVLREKLLKEWGVESKAVFLSNKKQRISKSALDNIFKQYSHGEITPHDLRHWVGTKLYNRTKNIKLVQEQLRHSSIDTAARYYVKINEGDLHDAVSNL